MPKPPMLPGEFKGLLEDVLQAVSAEGAAAAVRHQDILSRLEEQQDVFKQQLVEANGPRGVGAPRMSQQAAHEALQARMSQQVTTPAEAACEAPSDRLKQACAEVKLACADPAKSAGSSPDTVADQRLLDLQSRVSTHSGSRKSSSAKRDQSVKSGADKHLSANSDLQFGKKHSKVSHQNHSSLRKQAKSIVENDRFEIFISSLILANAFVMCWEVQRAGLQLGCDLQYNNMACIIGERIWPDADIAFEILDLFFGVMFTLEAGTKFFIYAYRYFLDLWNLFDFTCVLVFLIDKLAASFFTLDSKAIRMLRLCRLLRLVRLLKTLESLDALYLMMTALKGMLMVVVWAVALLVVILTACGLFLTQFLHSTYFSQVTAATLSVVELEAHIKMYMYFGTWSRCFLSMFEITLANWPPVARLLAEEVSELFTPLCLLHKLTIGFAVIGVINGVILQETFKVAATDDVIMVRQKKREQDSLRKKMRSLFGALDLDGDGDLDFDEFEIISHHPDVQLWLASMDVETNDLHTLFHLVDYDGDGHITPEELMHQIPRIKGAARSFDLMAMKASVR